MVEREGSRKLAGRVEMDDVALGGEKSEADGGKRGRSGPNKTPFVVAVETSDDGRPLRLLLHVVKVHDGDEIEKMARAHLESSARVVSDGLGCFRAVTLAGCTHEPVVAAQHGHSEKLPCFRWVNTVMGNVKTAIVGTLNGHSASIPGAISVNPYDEPRHTCQLRPALRRSMVERRS